jgi:hypothetical protein
MAGASSPTAGTSGGRQIGFTDESNSGNTFETAGMPPIAVDLPDIQPTIEQTDGATAIIDRESIYSCHSSIHSGHSYPRSRNGSTILTDNPVDIQDDLSRGDNQTVTVDTSAEFGDSIHAQDGDTSSDALRTCLAAARSAARMESTAFNNSYNIFLHLYRVSQGICALLNLFEASFTHSEIPRS